MVEDGGRARVKVVVDGREYVAIGPSNDPGSLICVLVLQMVRGGENAETVATSIREVLSRLANQARRE